VPVDVNTYGHTAPLVPEAPPERSTLGKVGEVGVGAAIGIAKLAWNLSKTTTLNVFTVGAYGGWSLVDSIAKGASTGGVLGAVNAVNPVYPVLAGGLETYRAASRGDYRAAGEVGATTAPRLGGTVRRPTSARAGSRLMYVKLLPHAAAAVFCE
jgi:hypothetical protein